MSNIILNKNSEITIDGVALTNVESYNLDRNIATIEAFHMADDHEKFVAGNKTFKFSISFDFDPANAVHVDLDGTIETKDIKVYPNGIAANYGYQLPSLVTGFSLTAQKGGKLQASAEFAPAGPLTKLGA